MASDPPGGYIELNGVSLHRVHAIETIDPWQLWKGPARRGTDRLISHVDGLRPVRRRRHMAARTLHLIVYGSLKIEDGTAWPDQLQGLFGNLSYLQENVTNPEASAGPTSLIAAIAHLPDGSATLTGDVHVEEFDWDIAPGTTIALATLDLTIPAGALT